MTSPSPSMRCPGCQSTRLNPGKLTQSDWHSINFKPQQNWVTSYTMDVAACLDCGLVSLFLDGPDREALRENQPAE